MVNVCISVIFRLTSMATPYLYTTKERDRRILKLVSGTFSPSSVVFLLQKLFFKWIYFWSFWDFRNFPYSQHDGEFRQHATWRISGRVAQSHSSQSYFQGWCRLFKSEVQIPPRGYYASERIHQFKRGKTLNCFLDAKKNRGKSWELLTANKWAKRLM